MESSSSGTRKSQSPGAFTIATRHSNSGRHPRLPNFLLIGAMKAGTTSLARYLMAHPYVFMAPGKEVHYFDRHFDKGMGWYATRFRDAPPGLPIGEATPNYLYSKDAIARIASAIPDVRLVAILRNPVDRAYSHYWHQRARGRETLNFEEAIEAEPERLASGDPESRVHFSYMDQGRYLDQLIYLERYFSRDTLHLILFEDIQQKPAAAFQSLCSFLGVNHAPLPRNIGKRYNAFVAFRSLTIRGVARRLSSSRYGLRLLGRVIGRLNVRRAPYPPMNPLLRAALLSRFREPNRDLAVWLGRDLSNWNS